MIFGSHRALHIFFLDRYGVSGVRFPTNLISLDDPS